MYAQCMFFVCDRQLQYKFIYPREKELNLKNQGVFVKHYAPGGNRV